MIASRKIRTFALAGLAAALIVGMSSPSALAGHRHRGHHRHHGHHVAFKHVHHGHFHHAPLIKYVTQAYTYPVIVYDCYGHPTTIWKTGYKIVPIKIYR